MTLRQRVSALEKEIIALQKKSAGCETNKGTVLGAVATEILRLQSMNEGNGLSGDDMCRNAEYIARLVQTYTELIKTLQL